MLITSIAHCARALIVLMLVTAATAAVQVEVTWDRPLGPQATAFSYGLNVFQGFKPSVAGRNGPAAYHDNVAYMSAGILRYHSWEMMGKSDTPAGWLVDPTTSAAWDTSRIAAALDGAYAYGPVRLMNIPKWPPVLADGSGRLRTDRVGAFADYCASLVRIINIDQRRGFTHWEVTNELEDLYPNDMNNLGTIYRAAAQAMKAVDPTIMVGGPAFARPDLTARVEAFISTAHPDLDFISYHSYSSGSTGDSNTAIWDSAYHFGGITTAMRASVSKYTARPIKLYHNEYNISWNPPDGRMNNAVGAVYDALAMASIISAGADGSMAWNESDGWYGKLDNEWGQWGRRPSAHLFALFNTHLRGAVITSSSSASGSVVPYAVAADGKRGIALINRSSSTQSVIVRELGGASTGNVTVYRVTDNGLATMSVATSALGTGIELTAASVAVLVLSGGNIVVAPSISAQPQARTVTAGQTATFSVTASGNPAPHYQWQKNGANISGATSASYTTLATVIGDNGATFTVVVSNSAGSISSTTVTLSVTVAVDVIPPATPGAPTILGNHSATPVLGGSTEPGAIITLWKFGVVVISVVADGSGHWNLTVSGLADGNHTLSVTATDAAGNISGLSPAVVVSVLAAISATPAIPGSPTNVSPATSKGSNCGAGVGLGLVLVGLALGWRSRQH